MPLLLAYRAAPHELVYVRSGDISLLQFSYRFYRPINRGFASKERAIKV
jgi:hypothetical protein